MCLPISQISSTTPASLRGGLHLPDTNELHIKNSLTPHLMKIHLMGFTKTRSHGQIPLHLQNNNLLDPRMKHAPKHSLK